MATFGATTTFDGNLRPSPPLPTFSLVLVISEERRREEKEDARYLRMEHRVGKFMRKFVLLENTDMDMISTMCHNGVLTVSVEKLPPPEPKKPKTIEVTVA